jgi:hypothetical protein
VFGKNGGREVLLKRSSIRKFATEIARDEYDHVRFLSTALGGAAVARREINIQSIFTAAANAAGLIKSGADLAGGRPGAWATTATLTTSRERDVSLDRKDQHV